LRQNATARGRNATAPVARSPHFAGTPLALPVGEQTTPEAPMATSSTQEFHKILHGFETAMLVTHEPDGHLRARPMYIADANDEGDLWFVTQCDTEKTREVDQNPLCAAVMMGEGRYLNLTGRAVVVVDRERVRHLWREAWRPWFPQGPDDPKLGLIHVEAQEAEYWDQTGARGLRFAFQAARAYLKRERMRDEGGSGTHGRITF
jgi:general stress protein 26